MGITRRVFSIRLIVRDFFPCMYVGRGQFQSCQQLRQHACKSFITLFLPMPKIKTAEEAQPPAPLTLEWHSRVALAVDK